MNAREKLRLFQRHFAGRTDVYGTYDLKSGRTWQVKAPVSEKVLLDHLRGRQPFGVYLLTEDRTRAVVADFDQDDPLPVIDCVKQAKHYGLTAYPERSKRKGFHVWVFLDDQGAPAVNARAVMQLLLAEIDRSDTEVFPKHNNTSGGTRFGNFINAPLFYQHVRRGRTVFVDPLNRMEPYRDQWAMLAQVQLVTAAQLDEICEVNDLHSPEPDMDGCVNPSVAPATNTYGLPPCAQTMLAEGVTAYQRVACFRLAVHFCRLGLPFDIAITALREWATKNRPGEGKSIITEPEIIEQARCAYERDYRGYGCEDPAVKPFCNPCCPVLRHQNSKNGRSNEQ